MYIVDIDMYSSHTIEIIPEFDEEITLNVPKTETVEKSNQHKALYKKQLEDFVNFDKENVLKFPNTLSSQLRKLIHEVSIRNGL